MLMPKRVKYRKMQKGRMRGKSKNGFTFAFGEFALKSEDAAYITDRQIEAARVAINRHMKRVGKLWVRIFPDRPVTRKPAEVRMGGGKGAPDHWAAIVKPGRILFEVSGAPENVVREAFQLAAHKLPVKTKTLSRADVGGMS
ncbi:MAG TPA: 50S ribosomal protein L16 [bacterium]|nr:50S ribosomal protein L16 [bacterium]